MEQKIKVGRNDRCPCGSGKKYKRCCADNPQRPAESAPPQSENEKVTLRGAIEEVQNLAVEKKETLKELGVFLFYSDVLGDAWLFEITDSDCIQIASRGEVLEVPLEENEETIIVEWSHTFSFKNKQVHLAAYKDKEQMVLINAPSQQLFAAEKRIKRRYSQELLDQVHISR